MTYKIKIDEEIQMRVFMLPLCILLFLNVLGEFLIRKGSDAYMTGILICYLAWTITFFLLPREKKRGKKIKEYSKGKWKKKKKK